MSSYLSLFVSFWIVDALAAFSPGPNFLLVTETAMRRSRPHAFATALGLATGSLTWCLLVVFGLAAVLAVTPWLYGALKICGGAYLVYLGISLWRSGGHADLPTRLEQGALWSAYVRGFVTNLTNPKSAIYYGSVFALFVSPGTPAWVQAVAVGIVTVDSVLWHGGLALLFSMGAVKRLYAAAWRPINRLAGAAMAAFGARMILARD